VRHNSCHPSDSDLTRVARQQAVITAIKNQLLSPGTFFRMPWVAWSAPTAIKSDMGGPTLLALFANLAVSGSPPTRILRPSGVTTLPDGEVGLTVTRQDKQAAARQLMGGK
jgi:anionic cell wall polymer biosynthesis LytR-Cps2A-Psr (LCP) family protein